MSSDAPQPPAPSSSGTAWHEASTQSDRPSNLTGSSHGSAYQQSGTFGSLHPAYQQSGLGSLHPAYHTEYQQPYYYYAGPQQQRALSSPSLHQEPSKRAMPDTLSLDSSAAQPLASPSTAMLPVQQGEWPLVCSETRHGMQAVTEVGEGQTTVEIKQLFLLRGLPGSGKSTLARYNPSCVVQLDVFIGCNVQSRMLA